MSDASEKIKERLNVVLAQKEERDELTRRLGDGFEQLIRNIEGAEHDLADYIDAQNADEETQTRAMQFLTSHFALKSGSYAAGVCIGHGVDPTLAFSIIQNRVLAGLHNGLVKHKEHCPVPQCGASRGMEEFLGAMAALMLRLEGVEQDALMRMAPRGADGKPIVN